MNYELTKSNLKIALRNLLKYKVQNAISILCLAVGIICFAATWHFLSAAWVVNRTDADDPRNVEVYFMEDSVDMKAKYLTQEDVQHLLEAKPASIDHLLFLQDQYLNCTWHLTDGDKKDRSLQARVFAVSPDYFCYYGYRSALTGKRIQRLEPGTIVLGDDLWQSTMGKDTNPVGWFASYSAEAGIEVSGTIQDVVHSDFRNRLQGIYVVSENPMMRGMPNTSVNKFRFILSEGSKRASLERELQALFPDYYVFVVAQSDGVNIFAKLFMALFLFLGASVLIIGGVGFLKMQLQLFFLRGREMALRRCMGARPWQLFWLLTLEVAIVFLLTAVVAVCLSVLIANYALPILDVMSNQQVFIDVELIYQYELWITLGTMLLTLLIAAASVRRTLHAPLGMTVGRSGHVSHRGRSLMLVVQYVVCILFMFAILVSAYLVNMLAKRFNVAEEAKNAKQCMLLERNLEIRHIMNVDELKSLPSTQHAGYMARSEFFTTEIDSLLYPSFSTSYNEDGSVRGYYYSITFANEDAFLALDFKPRKEASASNIPVYVLPEEADRLTKVLKAEPFRRQNRVLVDGKTYTMIGYAPIIGPVEKGPRSASCCVIRPDMSLEELYALPNNCSCSDQVFILQPKPHRYERLKEELNDLYHQKQPTTLMQLPIVNAYETWYAQVRLVEAMQQLCMLLAVVSLLCIIISVYSAISLDTRGREKEVAIRKVHGAKTWDIMRLFGGYYVRLIAISAVITIPICLLVAFIASQEFFGMESDFLPIYCTRLFASISIMVIITLLTIGQKIWRVAKTNPAEVVKKE